MHTEDKLDALRAELARQDAELEAAMQAISELPPHIEAHIPKEWLAELESLCTPPPAAPTFHSFVMGIRA